MNWLATTEKQLEQWGVKYHALIMGKTHFDICLDDKMITVSELLRDETLENCVVAEIVKAFKSGHKVLVCGNGGLAAESSHFVAELVGKFGGDTYLPAISLVENPALITAISNDFGYQMVFSHQISVLGNSGDILIAMTTSQSSNIYDAIIAGRKNKLITVSITGLKSKNMDSHYQFRMYGDDTAEIQNETIKFLHRIAFEVKRVYGK
jgi:D-sedoheptulose 7-phosphate isomerase